MSKTLTIIGATGIQGGSVVRALLDQQTYKLRAVTRNSKGESAKALAAKGIEVVEADAADVNSLKAAFAGSHAIFAVTNFYEALPVIGVEKSMAAETAAGINMADAAAATDSLEHYVWSTLPESKQISGGKVEVPYYLSKNQVDEHIRSNPSLASKTTFLWLPWYASNLKYPLYQPSPIITMDGSKTYVQLLGHSPNTIVPLAGDESANTGLFVRAILEQPEKTLPNKVVAGVAEKKTWQELLETYASVHNIRATFVQVSQETYAKLFPLWGALMNVSHDYLEITNGEGFTSTVREVLTKDDLGVTGLVGTAEGFARVPPAA